MISLIVGKKGSGKTKKLIDLVNKAGETSNGNVVCIEKGTALNNEIASAVRLVNVEEYAVNDGSSYLGFLSGICAGNYDITDIFCDATFKIIGKDFEMAAGFIKNIADLSKASNVNFTFTLSCDESELPEAVFQYANKI